MKLVTMKVVCLLVLLSGLFVLGLVLDISQVQLVKGHVLEYWPRQDSGALNLRTPGAVAGVFLLIIGLYGLLPKLPSSRNTTIKFKSAGGEVTLQLRPIKKVLLKVMRRMPEVYSIKLNVRPDAGGHSACIDADVVLKNCAALGGRQCAKIVAECLATTARELLGLEDLSAVRLNVKGVHVDAAASGKQIHDQLALRQEEEASAYAMAHPPISAVTLADDDADPLEVPYVETAEEQKLDAVEAVEEVTIEEQPEALQMDEVPESQEVPELEPVEEQQVTAPQLDEIEVAQEYDELPDLEVVDTRDYVEPTPVALEDVMLPPLMDQDDSFAAEPESDTLDDTSLAGQQTDASDEQEPTVWTPLEESESAQEDISPPLDTEENTEERY